MLSAGNSFGEMNGGVDGIINTYLSLHSTEYRIDQIVKDHICVHYAGELPVGSAIAVRVPGQKPKHDWLVYAPTMRVAKEVPESINAYLAMRAGLLTCMNMTTMDCTIACPLLCTGVGAMPVTRAIKQMREAYDVVIHRKLVRGDWVLYHEHNRALEAM
jgi:O-acetyl-ADP-ribose deacetylase (regulator of RNase III)